MSGRNLDVSTRHDVWIQADDDRISTTKMISKFLQQWKVVDVDVDVQSCCLQVLIKSHTVGSKDDAVCSKAGIEGQLHFVDADTINTGPLLLKDFEDVDIGQGLAGIENFYIRSAKRLLQGSILALDLRLIIHIKGSSKFCCSGE